MAVVGVYAARAYLDSDPSRTLAGFESQWLTNSAYVASVSLHTTGRLSLWQPLLGRGEPAIDNPFSFTLNPISSLPSLLFDPINGIKYSVVLYTVFAGLGGWVLARILNLGWLGRLLLALLCIGRGNMHAEISEGYFQLAVTQAYFPWVVAGALAIIRFPTRRYPVVLLAVVFTLLFWAGNIYYTLPSLIMIAALVLAFAIKGGAGRHLGWRIDLALIKRFVLAGVLIIGLSAATSLPIFANQRYIGGHGDEPPNVFYQPPTVAAAQFFLSDIYYPRDTWHQNYYSFVSPVWFVGLIFVLLPPISPVIQRFGDSRLQRRVIAVGLFMILFFLFWGTGTNPVMRWAYANLPLIGQWRTLSRMLTVSAFWITVLIALRIDGLWNALVVSKRGNRLAARVLRAPAIKAWFHYAVALSLIAVTTLAAREVLLTWDKFGALVNPPEMTWQCMNWLRAEHRGELLAVWGNSYKDLDVFLANDIRFTHINADFHPLGMMPTIYPGDLSDLLPEYLISFDPDERRNWGEQGYTLVDGAPVTADGVPCLMQNPNTFSYAFSVPLTILQNRENDLLLQQTTPIRSVNRQFDHVGLIVSGDPEQNLVVVAQELAYPGWRVTVDGLPAQLESVGQLVGVVLPPGAIPHRIVFVYDPPLLKLGGALTLMTALFCALYLLYAERLIGRRRPRPQHEPHTSYPPLSI